MENVTIYSDDSAIPEGYRWTDLLKESGEDLIALYERTLEVLSKRPGLHRHDLHEGFEPDRKPGLP